MSDVTVSTWYQADCIRCGWHTRQADMRGWVNEMASAHGKVCPSPPPAPRLGVCGTDETVGSGHPPWGHPQKESCREWEPLPLTPEDTQPDADRIDAAYARSFNDPSKPMLKPPEDTK